MNYKSVTIISIIATVIFVMPLFSFAGDETVPGTPFQVLQGQIDDLQQQINEIPPGSMCAAYSTTHLIQKIIGHAEFYQDVVVMSITLPEGDYVSTISLGVQYQAAGHGFWPQCWAFLDSSIRDFNTMDIIGSASVGGNVVGTLPRSGTNMLRLWEETNVALTIKVDCIYCDDFPETPLNILSGSWTLIKVEHQ